jgi:hypothetical protein
VAAGAATGDLGYVWFTSSSIGNVDFVQGQGDRGMTRRRSTMGHKQRYVAQGIPKINAEIAQKPRFPD